MELTGEPEGDETAEVRWVPLPDAQAVIASGEIAGAMTVIGVQSMPCCGGQPLADFGCEVAGSWDGGTLLSGQASPRALRISSTALQWTAMGRSTMS